MIHETTERAAQRREARADRILDAAMRLLGRDGVDGLTLQRVAREEGLVPAALYRYFPSKDALLAALQRRTVSALHDRLTSHLAALDADAPRREPGARALVGLVSLPGFHVAASREMPEEFRLVMTLLGDPRLMLSDEDAALTAPLLGALLGDVAALFDLAVDAGALPRGDSARRTLVFWAALQGTLALAKMARFDPRLGDVEALGLDAVTSLLRGWGAEPDAVSRATRALARRS